MVRVSLDAMEAKYIVLEDGFYFGRFYRLENAIFFAKSLFNADMATSHISIWNDDDGSWVDWEI
jgi:phage FluMu protein gp41|tara:strand:- start:639 stop:830 length:192 start_codon:yes stop_codon:yes gene_type:complete